MSGLPKPAILGGDPTRSKDNFLVYGTPKIEQAEIDEVIECLKSGWVGTGPRTHEFEQRCMNYKGMQYAVGTNSCTAALHLALLALDIGPGDEVITTGMTFCATVNAIIHAGATPVLADCDRHTMNIAPDSVTSKITSKTRAILPVHFAGRACDMDALTAITEQHNLAMIEDCAHAIETEYHGTQAGRFGDIACLSFYVTKNIITGEGGMALTDNASLADTIRVLSLHGMSKDAWKRFGNEGYQHYDLKYAGFKYNMMDLQASIGMHQLERIDDYWLRRKTIFERYNAAFSDLPCVLPAEPEADTRHAYHLYVVIIDEQALGQDRDWVLTAMTAENIGVGVHYRAINQLSYYREQYGWGDGMLSNAEWIGSRCLSLPLSAAMTDQDIDDVITAFSKVLSR